jgi:site-specific recombinase XerC
VGEVGLPYHSPHKFRHGFAVIALKNAKDIPALKAVSQNLMHSNLSITDGVYGILSSTDISEQIKSLGKNTAPNYSEKYEYINVLIEKLEKLTNSNNSIS